MEQIECHDSFKIADNSRISNSHEIESHPLYGKKSNKPVYDCIRTAIEKRFLSFSTMLDVGCCFLRVAVVFFFHERLSLI